MLLVTFYKVLLTIIDLFLSKNSYTSHTNSELSIS